MMTKPHRTPAHNQKLDTSLLSAVDGVKLTASQDFGGGSMFDVGGHTRLTIDCEIEGNGRCSIVSATDSASLTLTPNADLHGGSSGVSVNGAASFRMTGGRVHDNSGDGISVNSGGSIQISGGSIENNGTGVYVGSNSNLSLKGGTFTGNTNDVVIGAPTQSTPPSSNTPSVTMTLTRTSPQTYGSMVRAPSCSSHSDTAHGCEQGAMLTGDVSVGSFQINNGPQPNVQNQGTIDGNVSLGANTKLQNDGTIKGVVVTEEGASAAGNHPEGGTVSAGTPYTIPPPPGSTAASTPTARLRFPSSGTSSSPSPRTPAI